jgi:di/tricarboxylate transporter
MAKNTALSAYKAGERAKRSGHHSRAKMTIPLAIVAGFMPAVVGVWNNRSSLQSVGNFITSSFTGWDPATKQFHFSNMKTGMFPAVLGFGVHSLASKIGLNRAIARAGIPFFRI